MLEIRQQQLSESPIADLLYKVQILNPKRSIKIDIKKYLCFKYFLLDVEQSINNESEVEFDPFVETIYS